MHGKYSITLAVGCVHLGSSFWQSYELVEDYTLGMCGKSNLFFSNEKLGVPCHVMDHILLFTAFIAKHGMSFERNYERLLL